MDMRATADPRPSFWKSGFSKVGAALCFFYFCRFCGCGRGGGRRVCHAKEWGILPYGGRAHACGVRESGHREGTLYA